MRAHLAVAIKGLSDPQALNRPCDGTIRRPPTNTTGPGDRELIITRLIDAPRAALYRCWTEPALIRQWFAPAPWTTPSAEVDIRSGGSSRIVMRSPAGEEFSSPGVFLEVVPNEKLVFTDAFTEAWLPSQKAFMVGTVTFADEDGKTRYVARVQHWSVEDRTAHEEMGFHQGWNQCTDQLAALARTL